MEICKKKKQKPYFLDKFVIFWSKIPKYGVFGWQSMTFGLGVSWKGPYITYLRIWECPRRLVTMVMHLSHRLQECHPGSDYFYVLISNGYLKKTKILALLHVTSDNATQLRYCTFWDGGFQLLHYTEGCTTIYFFFQQREEETSTP